MTPPRIAAVPLDHAGVRLEPLGETHRAGLAAAGAAAAGRAMLALGQGSPVNLVQQRLDLAPVIRQEGGA